MATSGEPFLSHGDALAMSLLRCRDNRLLVWEFRLRCRLFENPLPSFERRAWRKAPIEGLSRVPRHHDEFVVILHDVYNRLTPIADSIWRERETEP